MNSGRRHYLNERGFTLIEMLLVLAIVGIIASVVFHFSFSQMQRQTYMKTINKIELTVRMAQAMAIEEQRSILCEIVGGKRFVVRGAFDEVHIFEEILPEGMTMDITMERNRIRFQSSGNVTQIGKMIFYMDDMQVVYSVNLGKGRFILHE